MGFRERITSDEVQRAQRQQRADEAARMATERKALRHEKRARKALSGWARTVRADVENLRVEVFDGLLDGHSSYVPNKGRQYLRLTWEVEGHKFLGGFWVEIDYDSWTGIGKCRLDVEMWDDPYWLPANTAEQIAKVFNGQAKSEYIAHHDRSDWA